MAEFPTSLRIIARLGLVALLSILIAHGSPIRPTQAAAGLPSAVFDPYSTTWLSIRNMTSAEHQDFFNTQVGNGYMMIDIEGDEINGTPRYASVWQFNSDQRGWAAIRDMTASQYGDTWQSMRDAGFRLTDFEAYETADGWRYAGIWRQNTMIDIYLPLVVR